MRYLRHSFFIACAFALGVSGARSAGVAILKQQSYHRDSSAVAVVYSRIFDSRGPYLRIASGSRNIDILRSNLVARMEVPDSIPAAIDEEKDLSPLRRTLTDLKSFTARYPRSAPLLEKTIASLSTHISRFEMGEIRFEGAWTSKEELDNIQQTRTREAHARELVEVEKRIFESSQRDKGLVLHDGKWMTKRESELHPPESFTELSECIAPLWNGELQGAKFAITNLNNLAAVQTGAPKVRTERLASVVRNLYLAESRMTQRIIASSSDKVQAAVQDENARKWLKPNGFGTVHKDAAKEARERAANIRKRSADELTSCRQELLNQLQETEIVTRDFEKLREFRVVLILCSAVRIVASRHFTEAEFKTSFPEESLASIRNEIRANESTASP